MNLELHLAKRIIFGSDINKSASRPIIRIALFSVALGLAVMLISVMVVTGFQNEITKKVTGFGGHIIIGNFSSNESYEAEPIDKTKINTAKILRIPHVTHIQEYAGKAGIIKTKDEIQGVVLKGVGRDYDWRYMQQNLVEGNTLHFDDSIKSDEIFISQSIASLLKLKLHNKVFFYFIEGGNQLIRKFAIAGIYNTGFEDVDHLFVFCDMRQIQRLNNWEPYEIGGYEVLLDDFKNLDDATEQVYLATGYQFNTKNIRDNYPQIFSWLGLIDTNVYIIIGLMLIVACINMISTLLIIILENTSDIGVLKALGASDANIRKVFFYVSVYLVAGGIILGNILGIGIAAIQYYFHVIQLPRDTYYISYAPISFSLFRIMMLNIGTMLLCVIVLLIPAMIVSRIQPIKAIRFE
ncbi:MAG: FtsX-like permease family protein [Bacteroidia bacterium]